MDTDPSPPDAQARSAEPAERILLLLAATSLFVTSIATGAAGGISPLTLIGAFATALTGGGWLIVRVHRALTH